MSARVSAGLLPVCTAGGVPRMLIAHMGGPLWARKDERAWSLVKGEFDPLTESPWQAANREWVEETSWPAPAGERVDLGTVQQLAGKVVHAFAVLVAAEFEVPPGRGNTVTMMWPPRSGRTLTFPEIDRLQWCDPDLARSRLVAAQAAFVDRVLGCPRSS